VSKPKAPDHLCEPESPRGPRTRTIPKGRLPQVWEPRALDNADGRCSIIKVLRAKVEKLKTDTGADSYQKELLCERAGFVVAILETLETRAMEDGVLDAGGYVQGVNSLMGLLKTLGLENRPIANATSLSDYIEAKKGKAE
jgi:hypothetical protein